MTQKPELAGCPTDPERGTFAGIAHVGQLQLDLGITKNLKIQRTADKGVAQMCAATTFSELRANQG